MIEIYVNLLDPLAETISGLLWAGTLLARCHAGTEVEFSCSSNSCPLREPAMPRFATKEI